MVYLAGALVGVGVRVGVAPGGKVGVGARVTVGVGDDPGGDVGIGPPLQAEIALKILRRGPIGLSVEIGSALSIRHCETCAGDKEELTDKRRAAAPAT